jgi:hypothetical protein
MIYIAHRGNINGPNKERENHPEYIDEAIELGYDVEIDVWLNYGVLYLGHDAIQYPISIEWLLNRSHHLWVHCKDLTSFEYFTEGGVRFSEINYFFHQNDDATLTSFGWIWVYPGKQPVKKSIAVMPEIHNDNVKHCGGICSDYIEKYKTELE